MNREKQSAVYLVLLSALLVRIGAALWIYGDIGSDPARPAPHLYPFRVDRDPLIYLMGAQQIIDTGINKLNFFPPLHFLFMAGCLLLGKGSMLFPVFANALVSWFTVVGIYLLAKGLYGERTALLAAVISGFYPNFIMYGLSLHPEMLTLFWIVTSSLMLVRYFHTAGFSYLVLSGVLWGLASQTRGGLHIFSLFMVTAVVVSLRGSNLRVMLKAAGGFLVATYATILAIAITVYPVHGDLSLNSKTGIGSVIAGVNRLSSACTDYGHTRGNIFYGVLPEEGWPEGSQLDPQELLKLKTGQIFLRLAAFIIEDPLTYLKNSLGKLSCLWSPNQLIIKYVKIKKVNDSDALWVNALCLVMGCIYGSVVIGGLCGTALARGPFRLLFILFIVFYNLLIFLAVGNSKLRLPLMPFFMIYCAYGMTAIANGTSWKKILSKKWLLVVMAIFMANGIYKSREFLLSPAEVYVRNIELRTELGFPKTALSLLEKGRRFKFTLDQKKRLQAAEERGRWFLGQLDKKGEKP